jgi:hypothetical protein
MHVNTLTLDDDVAAAIERLRRARDASLKDIVNDALRKGLSDLTARPKQRAPSQTQVVDLGRMRLPSIDNISDLERVVADFAGRGTQVTRIVLTPSALSPEARPEALLIRARKLSLTMSQLPSLDAGGPAMQLAPVAVEDLLLRPSVKIDYRRLETFVSGKACHAASAALEC